MDARSADLFVEEGILAERCGLTIARRGLSLALGTLDAVQSSAGRPTKDVQDDAAPSAPFLL